MVLTTLLPQGFSVDKTSPVRAIPASPPRDFGATAGIRWGSDRDKVKLVSLETIKALAQLEPQRATRSDVVRLLGEPNYEIHPPDLVALRKMLGKATVEKMFPAPDNLPRNIIMNYKTSATNIHQFLMVFLFQTDSLYKGYLWEDRSAMLASEQLARARDLIAGAVNQSQLLERFGPPPSAGALSQGRGVMWRYTFHSPQSLVEMGITKLELMWRIAAGGESRYHGIEPAFWWDVDDSGGRTARQPTAIPGGASLEQQFYATLQGKTIPGDPLQRARSQSILDTLLTAVPRLLDGREIGAVKLSIIQDDKINAAAARGPTGPEICVNTGTLSKVKGDDQLAAVMSHEIAHIVNLDSLVPLRFMLSLPLPAQQKEQFLHWSRMREFRADVTGAEIMTRAGYDPAACDEMLGLLEDETETIASTLPAAASPSRQQTTHPLPEMRKKFSAWYRSYRWPEKAQTHTQGK